MAMASSIVRSLGVSPIKTDGCPPVVSDLPGTIKIRFEPSDENSLTTYNLAPSPMPVRIITAPTPNAMERRVRIVLVPALFNVINV
jgi:hypothetical protein